MTKPCHALDVEPVPSRRARAIFATKIALLRVRRAAQDRLGRLPRHRSGEIESSRTLATVRVPLVSDDDPAERRYELGKIQNVRVAAARLDGTLVSAGAVFGFWRQVGRCTRRRGYVVGRQIQEGCLIPSIGGGLCLLSNALYLAAKRAGLEIVERHRHTRTVPGSLAELGEDATVAWNHIDLRFRHPEPWRLRVRLTATELIVTIEGRSGRVPLRVFGKIGPIASGLDPAAHACGRCGREDCSRFEPTRLVEERALTLALDLPPEFATGGAWTLNASSPAFSPLRLAAWRARLAGRAAHRRSGTKASTELARAEVWARALARTLPYEVSELEIDLRLLPWLWTSGALGGRVYDVIALRPALDELHRTFDAAAARHPERALLRDFRAPDDLVRAEREALANARRILTPHAAVARAFGASADLRPWVVPEAIPHAPGRTLLFPGPTHARKGAYEVREAARALDLPVRTVGRELEGDEFWRDLAWERRVVDEALFDGVLAVVQPAIAEERPRLLLLALASGVPVIATEACGLPPGPNVTLVPVDDPAALVAAIRAFLRTS